jgi:uncharacterized membrane protein YjfL (UPF0719 family)
MATENATAPTSDDSWPEARIRHLEMIQGAVSRLANDSFLVKGWAITVAGIILGFAVTADRQALALVSLIPTLIFWMLDTYYLRAERLFRAFYRRAVEHPEQVGYFRMDATSKAFKDHLTDSEKDATKRRAVALSATVSVLYLGLIAAACVTAIALGGARHVQPHSGSTHCRSHTHGDACKGG